jgi:hypothetical protein
LDFLSHTEAQRREHKEGLLLSRNKTVPMKQVSQSNMKDVFLPLPPLLPLLPLLFQVRREERCRGRYSLFSYSLFPIPYSLSIRLEI